MQHDAPAETPTPGPWVVDEHGFVFAEQFIEMTTFTDKDGTVKSYKRGLVALPYAPEGVVAWRANANLMAAAPDLLAAAKLVLEKFSEWEGPEEPEVSDAAQARNECVQAYEAVRAAVQKAEVQS